MKKKAQYADNFETLAKSLKSNKLKKELRQDWVQIDKQLSISVKYDCSS